MSVREDGGGGVVIHLKLYAGIPLDSSESEWLAATFDQTPLHVEVGD